MTSDTAILQLHALSDLVHLAEQEWISKEVLFAKFEEFIAGVEDLNVASQLKLSNILLGLDQTVNHDWKNRYSSDMNALLNWMDSPL